MLEAVQVDDRQGGDEAIACRLEQRAGGVRQPVMVHEPSEVVVTDLVFAERELLLQAAGELLAGEPDRQMAGDAVDGDTVVIGEPGDRADPVDHRKEAVVTDSGIDDAAGVVAGDDPVGVVEGRDGAGRAGGVDAPTRRPIEFDELERAAPGGDTYRLVGAEGDGRDELHSMGGEHEPDLVEDVGERV